jgi:hypothetical protein
MADIRLLVPLGEWTGEPRQHFTWFAKPNRQSLVHVTNGTATQHIEKTPHHNSLSARREYFPCGREYTTELNQEHHSSLLADVSHRKGSGIIILHATMAQYKPLPTAEPPRITTAGDYVSRLHPFLQALLPAPPTLGQEFSDNAKLAATAGNLHAKTIGPPTTRSHSIQVTWMITQNTDSNMSLIQHHTTQPCLPEESKHKRGIQLGLIAIHIIAASLEAIGIHINTIQLDSMSHQILEWTAYAAPRQGYNCISKHNTDVDKELQQWSRKSKTQFTAPDRLPLHDDDSDEEDDAPHCLTGPTASPTTRTTVLFPPASQYKLTINNTSYNYLPEQLLRERHHLPLFKKLLDDNCALDPNNFDNIAWELAAESIDTLNITRLLPVLKFTANEWSTGNKQHTHFQKSNECPFCHDP